MELKLHFGQKIYGWVRPRVYVNVLVSMGRREDRFFHFVFFLTFLLVIIGPRDRILAYLLECKTSNMNVPFWLKGTIRNAIIYQWLVVEWVCTSSRSYGLAYLLMLFNSKNKEHESDWVVFFISVHKSIINTNLEWFAKILVKQN